MKLDTQPSAAQMFVNDGSGQMKQIVGPRSIDVDWPIAFTVMSTDAESWMAHLNAEIQERGWSGGWTSSLQDIGNAGGMTFAAKPPATLTVQISWERFRNKDLSINARSELGKIEELSAIEEFLNAVSTRHSEKRLDESYIRSALIYRGLPWRGEVWLSDNLRLGPPSKYSDYLVGSNCLVVDMVSRGIGLFGAAATGRKTIQELRIFLCVLLGNSFSVAQLEHDWRTDVEPVSGALVSSIGWVGYTEASAMSSMHPHGSSPAIARRHVTRPGLGQFGISIDETEKWIPQDLEALWHAFICLPISLRERFLRAGNLLLAAHSLWPEHRTGYAAFHVVACEALKPPGKRYEDWNFYHVVEALVGTVAANHLKQFSVHPQKARSQHFHRAGLFAGELLTTFPQELFKDPSFDTMMRELVKTSRICLIEWLRKGGDFGSYRPVSQRRKPNLPSKSVSRRV